MKSGELTILLAEDDHFLATALGDKLTREGFRVFKAKDGEEALTLARVEKPDLVLLDLIMPRKNGFQTLEELKKDADTAAIPVLILSNLGQESDIAKAKSLGAIDYLVKSDWPMSEVVARIKKVLD